MIEIPQIRAATYLLFLGRDRILARWTDSSSFSMTIFFFLIDSNEIGTRAAKVRKIFVQLRSERRCKLSEYLASVYLVNIADGVEGDRNACWGGPVISIEIDAAVRSRQNEFRM